MLVAYCVRDILWLRLFAVAASLIAIPYFVLQPTTLWAPLSWSALFAAINAIQSWNLFRERRPVQLTPEEKEIQRLGFQGLPPRKVLQVLGIGSWVTAGSGERLLERGKPAAAISFLVSGKVQVTKDKQILGELVAGDLVGSALLLTGAMAEADAVVAEPVRAMRWEIGTLERYLAANPETRIVMQRHLARDLAAKLQRLGGNLRATPSPRPSSPDEAAGSESDRGENDKAP